MKQTQAEISGVVLVRMLRRLAEKRRRKYDPTRLYQGDATLNRKTKRKALTFSFSKEGA